MDTFMTRDGTSIYFKDQGQGRPIMFHHGWPLSSDDWDNQMLFFMQQGFRVTGRANRPR
jgi:non-heme chloroperoxidase